MALSDYKWQDAEQQFMTAVDSELGSVAFPALEQNRYYAEFLASGATAEPYVASPVVDEPTPLDLLTARVTAIEANELSDDAVDSALLTLVADLTARVAALEAGA